MILFIGVALQAARADETLAQTAWVVTGRVVDVQTGTGLQNARVTLVGHGAVFTSAQGAFRFERVRVSEYDLRVEALGYRDFREPSVAPTTSGPHR